MSAIVNQPVQESRKDHGEITKGHRFAPGNPGKPKGARDKSTRGLRGMILKALDGAGGVEYLIGQAHENPRAFLALVGRVLPLDVTSSDGSMRPVVALYMPDNQRDEPKLVRDVRPVIEHDATPAAADDTPAQPAHSPASADKA